MNSLARKGIKRWCGDGCKHATASGIPTGDTACKNCEWWDSICANKNMYEPMKGGDKANERMG